VELEVKSAYCFLERRMQMEPYNGIDPVWGWGGMLYIGLPIVLCLFVLLVLGAVGAPHLSTSYKKGTLYPILSIILKGARKKMLFIKSYGKGGVS
jgi:hypothetical protein